MDTFYNLQIGFFIFRWKFQFFNGELFQWRSHSAAFVYEMQLPIHATDDDVIEISRLIRRFNYHSFILGKIIILSCFELLSSWKMYKLSRISLIREVKTNKIQKNRHKLANPFSSLILGEITRTCYFYAVPQKCPLKGIIFRMFHFFLHLLICSSFPANITTLVLSKCSIFLRLTHYEYSINHSAHQKKDKSLFTFFSGDTFRLTYLWQYYCTNSQVLYCLPRFVVGTNLARNYSQLFALKSSLGDRIFLIFETSSISFHE